MGKCKCGADADVGFRVHGKPPAIPYCFPCLERDYPETAEDTAKLPSLSKLLREMQQAN